MTVVIETERLQLRLLRDDHVDAAPMLELLNDPGFVRFIGDRGVRTLEQAQAYVRAGTLASYAQHGYGMYAIERRSDGAWLGNAGLVRRSGLPSTDVGYALLQRYAGHGYAAEAVKAVVTYARETLGLESLCAIVCHDNARSIALLHKLGMQDQGEVTLPGETEVLRFFQMPKAELTQA